jgi:hypothetical protein
MYGQVSSGLLNRLYRMFSHTVENDRASDSHESLMHETASQRQRFLDLNKGPDIFFRMRQEAVVGPARPGELNSRSGRVR